MIWTPERQALALAEAERWRGVPHVDGIAEFPRGIDCIHYVLEILFAAGILERMKIGRYNSNIGIAKESDLMENEIIKQMFVETHPVEDKIEFGDVAINKTGRSSAHCGFLDGGGSIYHALANRAVTKSPWQHWHHKCKLIVRITQEGWRHGR